MPVYRRQLLKGIGAGSIGGSAILGSGALTQISSARTVTVNVTNDSQSTLSLSPGTAADGIGGISESDGELTLDLSDINADSQLLVGQASGNDPTQETISSTAFEITDNASYTDSDYATGVEVSVSTSAANSGLGMIFLPTGSTDDLANEGATGYTSSDQASVAKSATLSSRGTDIPSLPSRYDTSNDSATFLLDEESTVGAELLLQADAADLGSNPTFDITITAQAVEASLVLSGYASPGKITDRKGNTLGDSTFGNYSPTASGGTAYLNLTNHLVEDATVSATNSNVTVTNTNGNANPTVTSEGSLDIELSHSQSSDQSTDLALTASSGTVSPVNSSYQIAIPTAPGSAAARWTMDTSSVLDAWGSNDGSVTEGTADAAGLAGYNSGGAFDFAGGDNGGVAVPYQPDFSTTQTFSCWFSADSLNTEWMVGAYSSTNNNARVFELRPKSGNTLEVYLLDETATSQKEEYDIDIGSISANTTYHLAITYNASTEAINYYIDGSNVRSSTMTPHSGPVGARTGLEFGIGARQLINSGSAGWSDDMDGQLDDVRFYNKELTASEVTSLYNTGSI